MNDESLHVNVYRDGTEMTLSGRLDVRSASAVRTRLHQALDDGTGDMVVGIGSLEIWDGTGLGVLAGFSRRAQRSGRRLVFTDVQPRELRLLRVARVPGRATVQRALI